MMPRRTIYAGGMSYRPIRYQHRKRNGLLKLLMGSKISCKFRLFLIAAWCLVVGLLLHLLPNYWSQHEHPSGLDYLRVSRCVKDYSGKQMILSEPSKNVCPSATPLLMLVNSAPSRYSYRRAIRDTWGSRYHTVFFMGLETAQQPFNETELAEYSDLVIFRFFDIYQALTVKSCLMLQWAEARCPHAGFVMKIDDDVIVNPRQLETVLTEHAQHDLVGYKHKHVKLHRNPAHSWYVPYWLYPDAEVPEYLSGAAYMIRGKRLRELNQAAYRVPLMNMEDVYITHLVAKAAGLTLHHDRRLSRYKPIFNIGCATWQFATIHGYDPASMRTAWAKLQQLSASKEPCALYDKYFSLFSADVMLH